MFERADWPGAGLQASRKKSWSVNKRRTKLGLRLVMTSKLVAGVNAQGGSASKWVDVQLSRESDAGLS